MPYMYSVQTFNISFQLGISQHFIEIMIFPRDYKFEHNFKIAYTQKKYKHLGNFPDSVFYQIWHKCRTYMSEIYH